MKWFLMLLLALFVTALVANGMVLDNGYILIAYGDTTFETTLWMGLVLVLVLFAALWVIRALLWVVLGSFNLVVPVTAGSRRRRARINASRGLLNLIKGNWRTAHRQLGKAAAEGESPLVNYLAAARAAHLMGDEPLTGEYLRRADAEVPGATVAVGITQAQLHLSSGQLEQALAALNELRRKVPRHPYMLKLLVRVYYRLHEWESLQRLLPILERHRVLPAEEISKLQGEAYEQLFSQACERGLRAGKDENRLQPVDALWDSLSRKQKQDERLVEHCAHCLIRLQAWDRAEQLLSSVLRRRYSDRLMALYGRVRSSDAAAQLIKTEGLLKEHPDNPVLLIAHGRICCANELWGKARESFERSLKLSRSTVACNELGQLLAQLGEHEASTRYFREGLELATRQP
ncbi:heme biosynthesis HemY N-terminal domain-containing protein [Aestuariirhabdus litorea]|uniref:Heme biosynthesis protein HemY n=1 Tax=Aestuariirhabdus litorea TaxID=2528527 RepID=A0A3P3VKQ8_9GAMM|nr:heme biosynthesis HemY N-terminal domain-containing protein [Aestuariirhabdus litorea]RRJ82964.1 heme biosynthesis protein HemY [Aestuariirhabdus litorea]RWW93125.1 heme biosynthesis protein HemY [Endozoicomonadaceae bacterium GTF-13]